MSIISVPGDMTVYAVVDTAKIVVPGIEQVIVEPGLSGILTSVAYAPDPDNPRLIWIGVNSAHEITEHGHMAFHYTDKDGVLINTFKAEPPSKLPFIMAGLVGGYVGRTLLED
jgi:hypothetical protein